jgi:hypothetical protein
MTDQTLIEERTWENLPFHSQPCIPEQAFSRVIEIYLTFYFFLIKLDSIILPGLFTDQGYSSGEEVAHEDVVVHFE